MTAYLSGYRTEHNLPLVHHDPEPFAIWDWGHPTGLRADYPHVSSSGDTRNVFDPRREYILTDNPILKAFREYAALDNFGHVSHLIAHEVRESLAGRGFAYEGASIVGPAIDRATTEEFDHAVRVIDLLWQLTYPDIPYEEPLPEENFWDDRTTPHAYSEGDSKRDTIARRKRFAADLLPSRYETWWDNTDDVIRLSCRDCNTDLAIISTGPLLDPLDAAIDHEAQAHW